MGAAILSGVNVATPGASGIAPPKKRRNYEIIRTGLVAEYRFDEGEGQFVLDHSGNNLHLTLGASTGAGTDDPTWVPEGLQFGGDDFCRHPYSALLNPSELTLTVVAKVTGGSGNQRLVATQYSGAAAGYVMAYTSTTGQVRGIVRPLNTWFCQSCIEVHEGNRQEFDGPRLVATAATSYVPETMVTRTFTVGATSGGSLGFLTGVVAYVLLYNRPLTPTEVYHNYRALKQIMASRGVVI